MNRVRGWHGGLLDVARQQTGLVRLALLGQVGVRPALREVAIGQLGTFLACESHEFMVGSLLAADCQQMGRVLKKARVLLTHAFGEAQ